MTKSSHVLAVALLSLCIIAVLSLGPVRERAREDLGRVVLEREAAKTALVAAKAEIAKAKEETKTKALELAAMRQVANATVDDLDACRKHAEVLSQPCPGPCGVPDCRVLKNIVEGYLECSTGVQRIKKLMDEHDRP